MEGFGSDVGNIFANQLARVDTRLVDLLQQEASEGLHTAPQESGVKRHVDALEGNSGEAAVEMDGLGLGFGLFGALLNDVDEVSFDVLDRHLLHESVDIDLLGLEEVEDICQAVEGTELK